MLNWPLVGGIEYCGQAGPVVHGCKYPCHAGRVGLGRLDHADPNFLVVDDGADLYLNLVDATQARYFGPEVFAAALDFIDRHDGRVTIHCNHGRSRAPSIAMLWLAVRAGRIPDQSHADAKAAYLRLDPFYTPGVGIDRYLADHWAELR